MRFVGANLHAAEFHGVNLSFADFSEAILHGTEFHEVMGLKQQQLDAACGSGPSVIPEGLDWSAKGYGDSEK